MAKNRTAPKKKGRRTPTGRFVICPASEIAHDRVAVEVYCGQSGEHFFFLCGECTTRGFLNTWEFGWGWTLYQVTHGALLPNGAVFHPARVVGLPPARRIELEMDAGTTRPAGS